MTRLVLGLDIGWSKRRRSCALAVRGPASVLRPRPYKNNVSVGLFYLPDLLDELSRLARLQPEVFRDALLVVDGPVGPDLEAIPERGVDGAFGRGGFHNRAPGYAITQGSGLDLARATSEVLRKLRELGTVKPWLGGPLPPDGIVVAETNPTPAMALLLPQQPVDSLPSRSSARAVGGFTLRAKSDWYWHLGAGAHAARVLGDPSIAGERNHERVAGLFSLALALALADDAADGSSVVALGDSKGIYLAPANIDKTWEADVRRVGVHHGQATFGAQETVPLVRQEEANELAVAGTSVGLSAGDADVVTVVLNDNGGLNLAANPWLEEVELPCRLAGPDGIALQVTEAFSGRDDQYRIAPTALSLARKLGFDGGHLSKENSRAFEGRIEGS